LVAVGCHRCQCFRRFRPDPRFGLCRGLLPDRGLARLRLLELRDDLVALGRHRGHGLLRFRPDPCLDLHCGLLSDRTLPSLDLIYFGGGLVALRRNRGHLAGGLLHDPGLYAGSLFSELLALLISYPHLDL